MVLLFTETKLNSSFFREDNELGNCGNMSKKGTVAGLSESFEVDSWVVKVSGQSRDILFKKAIGKEMLSRVADRY